VEESVEYEEPECYLSRAKLLFPLFSFEYMKRFFVCVFVVLYVYNIIGYLVIFYAIQHRVRSDMWQLTKESLSESGLTRLAFLAREVESGDAGITWIEEHEFRFGGRMYDIVRSWSHGDSAYYLCINDVQEEELFSQLDKHVSRNTGDTGLPGKLDSFKDAFKESLRSYTQPLLMLLQSGLLFLPLDKLYSSVILDVSFPPPKALSAHLLLIVV
jgi:hypothetical protein